MSGDTKAILQAYSDGVNAWIAEHDGQLSTPFVVAGLKAGIGGIGGYKLAPWTPLDTATWQKVQAWSLGGNVDSEIFRFLADARLRDPAKTDELFPAYDPSMPVITATTAIGDGGANLYLEDACACVRVCRLQQHAGEGEALNHAVHHSISALARALHAEALPAPNYLVDDGLGKS